MKSVECLDSEYEVHVETVYRLRVYCLASDAYVEDVLVETTGILETEAAIEQLQRRFK